MGWTLNAEEKETEGLASNLQYIKTVSQVLTVDRPQHPAFPSPSQLQSTPPYNAFPILEHNYTLDPNPASSQIWSLFSREWGRAFSTASPFHFSDAVRGDPRLKVPKGRRSPSSTQLPQPNLRRALPSPPKPSSMVLKPTSTWPNIFRNFHPQISTG
jgi:hypothetical protein